MNNFKCNNDNKNSALYSLFTVYFTNANKVSIQYT